jgi:hypothetical protein
MTTAQQIQTLEAAIARIEHDPDSVIGGSKAFYSGMQTFLKPAAQRKIDSLNKKLNALYDQCEA